MPSQVSLGCVWVLTPDELGAHWCEFNLTVSAMLLMLGSEGTSDVRITETSSNSRYDLDHQVILLFRLYAFSGKDKRLLTFLCLQIMVSLTIFLEKNGPMTCLGNDWRCSRTVNTVCSQTTMWVSFTNLLIREPEAYYRRWASNTKYCLHASAGRRLSSWRNICTLVM